MESTCSFKSLREEACRAASLAKTNYLGRGRRDHSVCHNEMKLVRLGLGRADHVPASAGGNNDPALATAGQLQPEPAAH